MPRKTLSLALPLAIPLDLTEEEQEQLCSYAEVRGMTVQEVLRAALQRALECDGATDRTGQDVTDRG